MNRVIEDDVKNGFTKKLELLYLLSVKIPKISLSVTLRSTCLFVFFCNNVFSRASRLFLYYKIFATIY